MTRFVRVLADGQQHYGERQGEFVHLLDGAPWHSGSRIGEKRHVSELRPLCPVVPSKILCIGRNYRDHAKEMGAEAPTDPLVFMKPPSSLLAPGAPVVLPSISRRVDFEGELGVVIGKRGRDIRREQADEYVFGHVATCDVTARDLQKSDGQWTRAKGFDTFCPVAPSVTAGRLGPVRLLTRVNGIVRQDGSTAQMIFGVPELVAFISSFATLEPGDLILTGTPAGVGPLSAGDRVEVAIEDLEALRFEVGATR